jgi:hypothetical protein
MEERDGLLINGACVFCKEGKHLEMLHLPCGCSYTIHSDCFATYTFQNRRRVGQKWKLQCFQCLKIYTAPEHTSIQITIPKDDDYEDTRPLTRREMRCEQWKIGTAMSLQCLILAGVLIGVTYFYVNLPNMIMSHR